MIIQGAIPLLQLYLMKLIIDGVSEGISAADKTEAFSNVLLLIIFAASATFFNDLCSSLSTLVKEAQSFAVTDYMQSLIHKKSISVDLEFYDNAEYYDTLHRSQQQSQRSLSMVNNLTGLVQNGISIIVIGGLLLSFHWMFSIILIISVIPGILIRIKYSGEIFRWQWKRTPIERKTAYYNSLIIGNQYAKEIRIFKLGKLFIKRYQDLRKLVRNEKLNLTRRRSLAFLAAKTNTAILTFGSFTFFTYRALHNLITLGDMVMYFQAFKKAQSFLTNILGNFAGLYEDNLFLSNLYKFLDLKPRIIEAAKPLPIPKPIQKNIIFDNISFSYPGSNRKILENINIQIKPGEKIAFVGENGAGKTTLIKLLCRLYDPSDGEITFDGVNSSRFSISDLRDNISIIFQDYIKYNLTANENIWFGNIGLSHDDQRIKTSAENSGADEVIDKLSKGYETILGKRFDKGEELSIGEWQKIALARAFLQDSQIIILDEPTSSMDAKAEYEVFQKFKKMTEGRTAILISHRFSTVRMADRIYVLNKGRIIENGSHEELIKKNGHYAGLFNMQAQHYKKNL